MKKGLVIFFFWLASCLARYPMAYHPPDQAMPHAIVQTESFRPNFLSVFKRAILEIRAINGQPISPREEENRLLCTPLYSRFDVPAGDTFIELRHYHNGDYGYVRFTSGAGQTYTISYKNYPRIRKFKLIVKNNKGRIVTERTFRKREWGDYETPEKEGALLDAIAMNDVKQVRELLDKGANPNWTDANNGLNALSVAVRENNGTVVKMLIHAGVDIDSYNGFHALNICAALGYLDMTRMLITHGADPNLRPYKWNSPLMEAARHGHEKIVGLLLKQGAYTKFRNMEGDSALDLAKRNGYQKIVQLLSQ
ncbi:MAG: hypothetical protein D6677_08535 [Calditrichaeota bacterium]|nr:MAG: hypothetical protein D6677_08535 [Calditrichota bacterium]